MKEQWKPIPGFEGYEVSDCGRVRSYWRQEKGRPHGDHWVIAKQPQRIMSTKGRLSRTGYPALCIRDTVYPVHRLVLLAFVGPCPEGLETCHNDGNPENNHLSNLRYDTHGANVVDMYNHLDRSCFRKLSDEEVVSLRKMAKNGGTRQELAEIFDIAEATVTEICHGRAYEDIGGPAIDRLKHRSFKLTDKQVVEIRRKLKAGAVGRDLANQYNVHESTISLIKSGKRREYCYAKANQD